MKKEIIFYKLWQMWNLLEACCSISHSCMKGRSDPGLGDNCFKKLKYCLDSLLSLPLMSLNLSHSLYFLLLQFLPSQCQEQLQRSAGSTSLLTLLWLERHWFSFLRVSPQNCLTLDQMSMPTLISSGCELSLWKTDVAVQSSLWILWATQPTPKLSTLLANYFHYFSAPLWE